MFAAVLKQVEAQRQPLVVGRATELKCPSCRGILHEQGARPIPPGLIKAPCRSKNRRIRKKQLKRWKEETRGIALFHAFHQAITPRGYVCAACRRTVGFYQAIGTNMFPVEPMPNPTHDYR